jgi:acyl-CoA thioester hydrolase
METRERYAHTVILDSRWMDNDAYGHVNNVAYYSFFDTAVNRWLIDRGLLSVADSPVIGLVVETGCRYHAPLSFPDRVAVGLRVAHLGNSSVRYELAVFRNDDDTASAEGHFVHVYVDRLTRRPTPIPHAIRSALSTLQLTAEQSRPGAAP